MSRMAFVAKLVIQPEKVKEFEQLQTKLRDLTHAHEPGVPVYELYKDREKPYTYLCVASFVDQAAFDTHMSIDFHDELAPKILDCLAEEMELSMYDSIEKA